jgi:predicted tellurium resistance membrane protein TerC
MNELLTAESLISFVILVVLEIVLGIDNVIFVSIIINRVAKPLQQKVRLMWMLSGIVIRSILLSLLSWLLAQKGKPVFTVFGKGFDLAGIIMILGGLFLIYKSVKEIHQKLEDTPETISAKPQGQLTVTQAVLQIILIDSVFSFDSVITAGGTASHLEIMIAAVVVALVLMFLFSASIADFIHKHPTLKMLALSFLVMIGLVLFIEGWDSERVADLHLKNYVYFAMAFSFIVEMLNLRVRKQAHKEPVELREPTWKDVEITQISENDITK